MATAKKKAAAASAPKKPPRVSYGAVAADGKGVIHSVQSAAGRSDKASLILRYASIDALNAPGEIVHAHSAKFHRVAVAPDGVCHAVSQDGSWHSNAGGSWKSERLTKKPLVAVAAESDLVVASGDGPALFVRRGGAWLEQETGLNAGGIEFFSSFAAYSTDDVYAAGTGGLAHFDGTKWSALTHGAGPKSVVALSRDEVYVVDYSGLHRGNAKSGFSRIAEQKLQHACLYQGELYCAAYSGGVFRWRDDTLTLVSDAELAVADLVGSGKLLCAIDGMQQAVTLFDGKTWSTTRPT